MITITQEEIEQLREIFIDNRRAKDTIKILEGCSGNINEAMNIIISIEKDEYTLGDKDWIDFKNILKDLHKVLCSKTGEQLTTNCFPASLALLSSKLGYPDPVLVLGLACVLKIGVENFCNSE